MRSLRQCRYAKQNKYAVLPIFEVIHLFIIAVILRVKVNLVCFFLLPADLRWNVEIEIHTKFTLIQIVQSIRQDKNRKQKWLRHRFEWEDNIHSKKNST